MRLSLPQRLTAQRARWRGLLAALLLTALVADSSALATAGLCDTPGQWYDPQREATLSTAEALAHIEDAHFILLGERHDSSEHHRWQLHLLAALLGRSSIAAVGFEMLPRGSQDALDRWVSGEIRTEEEMLSETRWDEVWGFDPQLYLPLLHFVRMHRIPSIALNVERETVRAVRERGYATLDEAQREGVGQPADPHEEYQEQLAEVLIHHPGDIDLEHFIEAQAFWDRAMAEALSAAYREHGGPVVGLVGRGHVQYGHGIPFQLADLGHEEVAVLLPHATDQECPAPGRADLLFTVAEPPRDDPPPPRMGVALDTDDEAGILIVDVMADSPAEAAGVEPGDRILKAAGRRLEHPRDLQAAVREQPAGTWLPLHIERDGEEREIVVKFP